MLPNQRGVVRRALVVLLASFVLIAVVYRKTPMNFLRSESGWFLFHAYSASVVQQHFLHGFFTGSYGGHYTPLAFLGEFEMAKIAGTNESIWKWRQIIVLAFIAAGVAGTVHSIGGAFQLAPSRRWLMAAALAAGSIYRPEMMDFVSWPFMILQLLFIGLLMLVLYAVLCVATDPDLKRWPWIAALAAAGSLHVSGMGMCAVAAVAVVFSGILLIASRSPATNYYAPRRRIASALITMLCLAVAHGWAMLHFLPAVQSSAPVSSGSFLKLILGFTANLAITALRTFVGTTIPEPDARALAYSWPYGLLVIAGAVFLLRWLLRKSFREPTPENVTRFALHTFSIGGFFALIALIAIRQFQSSSMDASATAMAVFAAVPRYLVPLHFLALGSAADLAVRLARRSPRFSSGLFCALAVAAFVAQVDYRWSTFPQVATYARISHSSAWGLIVATARECRAAQLPIPNIPLATLTQEFFDWDPKMFEPLLRRELNLGPDDSIEMITWEQYRGENRDRYRKSVPSLQLLEEKLYLKED
ncbi:MAG: hypothetical protein M3N12_03810 [Verrucomicrobiota bacterium]|nr:hypothetical protein [Verrucomicrobiota bacterium]